MSLSMSALAMGNYFFQAGAVNFITTDPKGIENLYARRSAPSQGVGSSTLRQIREWIEECIVNHTLCQTERRESSIGTEAAREQQSVRLIHLSGTSTHPKLRIEVQESLASCGKFVILSHCWGTGRMFSLLRENFQDLCSDLPYARLPQTFRDAVDATLQLGITFLWIDALCIIQDSKEDWVEQSILMGDIYDRAFLNFAATSSGNSEGGLFHNQRTTSHPCILTLKTEKQSTYLCEETADWDEHVESSPLGKRAWVVQERLLSHRILHFTKEQIYWECRSRRASEFRPSLVEHRDATLTANDVVSGTRVNVAQMYSNWDAVVMIYSKRLLTYDSDKLMAVAGLATRACAQAPCDPKYYVAGLFRGQMPGNLLWRMNPHSRLRKRVQGRAPSWSWAAVNGETWMAKEKYWETEKKNHARIIGVEILSAGGPFSNVVDARLKVEAPIWDLLLHGEVEGSSLVKLMKASFSSLGEFLVVERSEVWWDDTLSLVEANLGSCFFLLVTESLGWFNGLVLTDKDLNAGQYRRVGQLSARAWDISTTNVSKETFGDIDGKFLYEPRLKSRTVEII